MGQPPLLVLNWFMVNWRWPPHLPALSLHRWSEHSAPQWSPALLLSKFTGWAELHKGPEIHKDRTKKIAPEAKPQTSVPKALLELLSRAEVSVCTQFDKPVQQLKRWGAKVLPEGQVCTKKGLSLFLRRFSGALRAALTQHLLFCALAHIHRYLYFTNTFCRQDYLSVILVTTTTGCPLSCKGPHRNALNTREQVPGQGAVLSFGNRGQGCVGRAIHDTDKICPLPLLSPCSPQYPQRPSLSSSLALQ